MPDNKLNKELFTDDYIRKLPGIRLPCDYDKFRKMLNKVRDDVISALSSQTDEELRLTLDEVKKVLCDYAVEVCISEPIREWNWTEMIQKYLDAQLAKVTPIMAARELAAAEKKRQACEAECRSCFLVEQAKEETYNWIWEMRRACPSDEEAYRCLHEAVRNHRKLKALKSEQPGGN